MTASPVVAYNIQHRCTAPAWIHIVVGACTSTDSEETAKTVRDAYLYMFILNFFRILPSPRVLYGIDLKHGSVITLIVDQRHHSCMLLRFTSRCRGAFSTRRPKEGFHTYLLRNALHRASIRRRTFKPDLYLEEYCTLLPSDF